MNKRNYKLVVLLILFVISVLLVPLTFGKYTSTYSRTITLNISKPTYTVVFHSNTEPDQTVTQNFTYGTAQNLNSNSFTNGSKTFLSWNTSADGSGTEYQNGEEVNNLTSVNNATIDLYAQWLGNVAEINGVEYPTIHDAVAAVLANDVQTEIKLLADIELSSTQRISVPNHKNIVFNLNGHTISNVQGADLPLFETEGTIRITNGTLTSTAIQGVINVNTSTAKLYVDNVTVSATGKQAIFNDGGYVEINDGAILTTTSNQRAAVQNQAGATLKILGGTIKATRFTGVVNYGTLIIGNNDGTVSRTSPSIQGTTGVNSTVNYKLFDGIIKGSTAAVNDVTKINEVETGYEVITSNETIGGANYHTLYLVNQTILINFNGNGGTSSEASRRIEIGTAIGPLPTATNTGKIFEGWFDDPTSGNLINASTVFNTNTDLYAHWVDGAAEVNGVFYQTIQEAFAAITTNNETTLTLYTDTSANFTIASGRKIIIDLNGHTLSKNTNAPVFENRGKLKIMNGTITSNATQGAINNNAGATLEINNASIIATHTRQALYNNGGTALITNNSVLSATSTERAALHNLNNGTVTILSGTIISTGQNGIENVGTINIGSKDGNISQTDPIIMGVVSGIKTTGTLNFYDGIIKGITSTVNGTISDHETGSSYVDSTEVIDGNTYNTKTQS
ncbi:MAG: InlB B-repeat-containing protein [Bacilli bacterium]|nr:InlB B-repeat-containing protein [Bacilli bacterium]